MNIRNALLSAITILISLASSAYAQHADEWRFKVMLDGSEIGYHNFRLSKQEGETQMDNEWLRLETETESKRRLQYELQ